jgi:hypothetical protein
MKVKSDRAEISPLVVFFWLLAAALATYYNTFRNAFQLDDFHIAVNNPWLPVEPERLQAGWTKSPPHRNTKIESELFHPCIKRIQSLEE